MRYRQGKLRKFLSITLLASPLIAGPAHGADQAAYTQLKGEDLRAAFSNTKTLSEYRNFKGIYNKGYDFTEFHHANGTTDYTETGAVTEKGTWKIVGDDKVCYKYPDSPTPNRTHCFFVYKQDKCYYNYSLGAMTLKGPRSWEFWTSRFVRKGSGGHCGDVIG